MDLLQRELTRKKEALLRAKGSTIGSSKFDDQKKRKYLKNSELRRIEEEEQEERERKRWRKNLSQKVDEIVKPETPFSTLPNVKASLEAKKTNHDGLSSKTPPTPSSQNSTKSKEDVDDSPCSITRKLRQMGLIVRYFGEGNTERAERLQKALEQQSKTLEGQSELEEFRLGQGHGIRNPFLQENKQLKQDQQKLRIGNERAIGKSRLLEGKKPNPETATHKVETEEDQSDPPKVIYKYLKGLLKEWERELGERPESTARSVGGRNESKTLKQCKDYIRPLFKLLKSRKLEEGLQFHLLKLVNFAKEGEFVKANDAYMDIAIGRAAWPIGVTMVGIHARSGRAKIESANVAHVMNSELQRKYLTSVKRLLTFDQNRRTDVDPSKKVR